MLKPLGYATIIDPNQQQEYDTTICRHCNKVIFVKPRTAQTTYLIPQRQGGFREEPGAFCRCCMGPVCLPCDQIGTCTPFERSLEQAEARGRFRRSAGLL
jgi:DNA-directed RNA polymerase subunit RPC12/RpoP